MTLVFRENFIIEVEKRMRRSYSLPEKQRIEVSVRNY